MTINELVQNVKSGNYPDVERPQGERVLTMVPNLIINYSIILANCLLNEIPEDLAPTMYPKRVKLYDDIMLAVTTGNYGRVNKLVAIIDKLCKDSIDDQECWTKRREANNICQWAADYFAWNDSTRQEFYGASEPVEEEVDEAEDINVDEAAE